MGLAKGWLVYIYTWCICDFVTVFFYDDFLPANTTLIDSQTGYTGSYTSVLHGFGSAFGMPLVPSSNPTASPGGGAGTIEWLL